MKNVKIITCEYLICTSPNAQADKFVSFVNYMLRLYYDLNSKDKSQYHWLPPLSVIFKPEIGIDELFLNDFCTMLETEKVDVLGLSVYVWNKPHLEIIAREVKRKLPHIIIVAGGPELDAHKNSSFFLNSPWYDYVIYGDGEKSFTDLLDYLAGINVKLTNVVCKDGTVHPHEVFNDRATLNSSPYIRYGNEIRIMVDRLRTDFKNTLGISPRLIGVWETTKGCPYACSFCDWSSGLHNKVRFWNNKQEIAAEPTTRPNFELELDFFADIRLNMLQWSNPNVGLNPQDRSIVEYWCKIATTNVYTPKSFIFQVSKLKKEESHALYSMMLTAGLEDRLKFDLQDLDPVVLENIDRPEIPWPEHRKMIVKMIDDFPKTLTNFKSKINFIWGLPGQTTRHFDCNLREAVMLGMNPFFFFFEMLPNSPAADPEYIQKFGLVVEKVNVIHYPLPPNTKVLTADLLRTVSVETTLVTASNSLSKKDWFMGIAKNYIFSHFYKRYISTQVIEVFLANFYRYLPLVDDMYEHFQKHNAISVYPHILMENGVFARYRHEATKITQQIYGLT